MSALCALLALSLTTACSAPGPDPVESTVRPTAEQTVPTSEAPAEQPTLDSDVVGPSEDPVTPYPSESPAPAPDVDVLVTYADWVVDTSAVEVGAFASTLDLSGTCTLELSRDGASVTATSMAQPSASTMSCALSVPGDSLSPGTWVGQVTYSSGETTGESDSVEVIVP